MKLITSIYDLYVDTAMLSWPCDNVVVEIKYEHIDRISDYACIGYLAQVVIGNKQWLVGDPRAIEYTKSLIGANKKYRFVEDTTDFMRQLPFERPAEANQIRHTVANRFPEFRVFRDRKILPDEPEVLLVSPSPSGGRLGGILRTRAG